MRGLLFKKHLLKHPFAVAAPFMLLFGVGLSLFLGVIFFAAMGIEAILTPLIHIVIWSLVSCVFFIMGRYPKVKLAKMKAEGIRYDAEIVKLVSLGGGNGGGVHLIRVGAHTAVYAECVYINRQGHSCIVRSSMFLWSSHDDAAGLKAVVYVSDDPAKYAVEITGVETNEARYDFDYR